MYERHSDGSAFKKEEDKHFKVVDGKWELTEDLSLADDFKPLSEDPSIISLEDTFHAYVNGDAENQGKYLNRLLHNLAKKVDALERK